jgi:hypothetical protein
MSGTSLLELATGLVLVAPGLPPATLLGTALAVNVCNAIVCRVLALNNGYPKRLWTALGFVGGVWAVALLLLLPRRTEPSGRARPVP